MIVGGDGTMGTLRITGGYTQQAGGSVWLDLASDSDYESLRVDGAVDIQGGSVNLRLLGGYVEPLRDEHGLPQTIEHGRARNDDARRRDGGDGVYP